MKAVLGVVQLGTDKEQAKEIALCLQHMVRHIQMDLDGVPVWGDNVKVEFAPAYGGGWQVNMTMPVEDVPKHLRNKNLKLKIEMGVAEPGFHLTFWRLKITARPVKGMPNHKLAIS